MRPWAPGDAVGAPAGLPPRWGCPFALRRRRETPSSAAGPRGWGLKGSLGILRALEGTWFLLPLMSASPTLFLETSEVAEKWEGRRVNRRWRPGSGSSGAGGVRVRKEALARGGRGGRARRTQPGKAEGGG